MSQVFSAAVPPGPVLSEIADPAPVTVVIVSYNPGPHLARAVASLAAQTRRPAAVIVVDNASRDHGPAVVDWTALPGARLVALPENLGFAAASNLAVGMARTPWVAMLNPDATAAPDWIERLLAATTRHPGVPLFASAQLCDDAARIDGAGDVYNILGLAWRGGHGRPVAEMPGEGTCFGACGAGLMVARDAYLRAGGMDESFFCYLEDADLAYRLHLRGQECVFVPDARIRHVGGASCGRQSGFTLRLSLRNRLWMVAKNTPLALLALSWPLLLAGLLLMWLQGFRAGQGREVTAGLVEALAGLGRIRASRRLVAPPLWPPPALRRSLSWNPLAVLRRAPCIRGIAEPVRPLHRGPGATGPPGRA